MFLEELNSTSGQFLLCGDFNFHVDDNQTQAKQFHDLFPADLKQHVNGHTPSSGTHIGSPHHSRNGYYNFSYKNFTRSSL